MRKERLIIIFITILCFTGCAFGMESKAQEGSNQFSYEVSPEQIKVSFTIDSMTIVKGSKGKTKVWADQMVNTFDKVPRPFKSYRLALPQGKTIGDVTVSWDKGREIKNIKLKEKDVKAIYGRASHLSYGEENGWSVEVFTQNFKGVQVAYISIFPVGYDSAKKILTYSTGGTVTVSLNDMGWDLSHLTDTEYIKQMVDNPDMINTYKKGKS